MCIYLLDAHSVIAPFSEVNRAVPSNHLDIVVCMAEVRTSIVNVLVSSSKFIPLQWQNHSYPAQNSFIDKHAHLQCDMVVEG